jgi:hypothetical protein
MYLLPDGGVKLGAPLDCSRRPTPHLLQKYRMFNLETTFRLFGGYMLHSEVQHLFHGR